MHVCINTADINHHTHILSTHREPKMCNLLYYKQCVQQCVYVWMFLIQLLTPAIVANAIY